MKKPSGLIRLLLTLFESYAITATLMFAADAREPQFVSAVVMLLAFGLLSLDAEAASRRIRVVAAVLGFCFGACTVLANYALCIELYGGFFCFDTAVTFLLSWVAFTTLLTLLYQRLSHASVLAAAPLKWSARRVFLVCFFSFAAVYTLAFLCHYPGNVMADMRWQLVQIVGLDPYTNHHPMAHTLAMKVFFDLGVALFHSQNAGVACITIAQYLAVSAAFAYTVSTMARLKVRAWLVAASALFFAFAPNNLLFAITPVKDIPFSILSLTMLTALLRIVFFARRGETKRALVGDMLLLFVGSFGACVMRTNGLYAFIPFLALCFVFLRKRDWRTLPVMGAALVLALVFRGPVLDAYQIPPPDPVESLSLPVQHIARVVTDNMPLTDEEYALLSQVVNVEKIPETYVPYTSDYIKALVRETDNQAYLTAHAGDYFRLWVALGLRYPAEYLYAQIDETVGFWYPNVQYESMYLGGIHKESTRLDIETQPKLTGIIPSLLTKWLTGPRDFPVYALIFSIGTATWIAVAMFGMAVVGGGRETLLPYLFQFLVFDTLMVATPVHAEFRYLYSLFTMLPLVFVLPFLRPDADGDTGNAGETAA